ncbi:MAG: GNAT family N-acetyltransferase [Chloroflexi bacterium]|nr:GNAT family N-acetyltransferase [Chloroflexota bacterium]
MAIAFRDASQADIDTIRALADRIWHACYPGMISVEQIRFMLAWMYAPMKLAEDMQRGVRYELALIDGHAVGYLGHELHREKRALHLHKIYLVPELHGRGVGQAMLAHVVRTARASGMQAVELGVNKTNARALAAYRRAGFTVAESFVRDIGNGFVMDDHLLRLELHTR